MTQLLNNYLITLVAIVGLIVLTAMGKVTADTSVPLIVALTGVHIGANISTPTATPTPPPAPVKAPVPPPAPPVA